FVLPRTVCKREITREEALVYLRSGRTELLTEFTSRFGRPFSAVLFLKENGRHGFEFPPRGQAAAGATAPATGESAPAAARPRRPRARPRAGAAAPRPAPGPPGGRPGARRLPRGRARRGARKASAPPHGARAR